MDPLEGLSDLSQHQPDPRLTNGEKLLVAMRKNKASDLRAFCGKCISFKVAGRWQDTGSRVLTEREVHQCVKDLVTAEQFENARSGNDLQVSHSVAGYGDFFVRAFLRDGKLAMTAVNA